MSQIIRHSHHHYVPVKSISQPGILAIILKQHPLPIYGTAIRHPIGGAARTEVVADTEGERIFATHIRTEHYWLDM